jgi:hypothetical protein
VLDRATSLTWQGTHVAQAGGMSWTEALAHCEGLDYSGSSDWRLPDVHELISLRDFTRTTNPDSALPGAVAETFWTSTPLANSFQSTTTPVLAHTVNFRVEEQPSSAFGADAAMDYAVRCVRGGR